jgi:hypothetical protein
MKGTDRFLVGIVALAVVLVGVVLAVALMGGNRAAYRPDDTPQGVAHNYLLALQRQDYERAHGYLYRWMKSYPLDVNAFERDVKSKSHSFGYGADSVSLAIEDVNVTGDKAEIVVRRTGSRPAGLFGDVEYSTTFPMSLRIDEGAWKITNSGEYWANCWLWPQGCE